MSNARSPLLRFLLGSLSVAIPAATVDVVYTLEIHRARLFGINLALETVPTHLLFAALLGLPLGPLFLLLGGRRASAAKASAFCSGLAAGAAGYGFVFASFFYVVGRVDHTAGVSGLLGAGTLLPVLGFLVLAGFSFLLLRRGFKRLGFEQRGFVMSNVWALALCGMVVGAAFPLHEQQRRSFAAVPLAAGASGPPADGSRPRNVLWIVMDTTRRDRVSAYAPELGTTPHLQALSEQGVVFERAFSAATFTLTSHATMLTGTHPSFHGAHFASASFPSTNTSLAIELARQGWQTAAFVSNHVLSVDTGIGIGFQHYDDLVDPELCYSSIWDLIHNVQAVLASAVPALRHNGQPHWIEDHQRPAGEQNERTFAWLDEHAAEPFFLFVNFYDAHWPLTPDPAQLERFAPAYDGPMTGFEDRDDDFDPERTILPEDYRYLLGLYDAELASLDQRVWELLEHVRALGQLDNTLVVITADHGEHFGEHGMLGHYHLFETGLGVPLIMRMPGLLPAGKRIAMPVQAADVAPTVLELMGQSIPSAMLGRSLLPLVRGEVLPQVPLIAEAHPSYEQGEIAARMGGLKLILGTGLASEEQALFDLALDPGEEVNLLADGARPLDAAQREIYTKLRAALDALPRDNPDEGEHGPVDRRRADALRGLGYTE